MNILIILYIIAGILSASSIYRAMSYVWKRDTGTEWKGDSTERVFPIMAVCIIIVWPIALLITATDLKLRKPWPFINE
jgi:hypothetical protein